MAANRSSDFSYPIELIGEGTCNISCPIRTKPEIENNKHSIYYKLNENSLQTLTTYSLSGYFYINIPQAWFNGNNNVLTIQVDTYDANKKYQYFVYKTNYYVSPWSVSYVLDAWENATITVTAPQGRTVDEIMGIYVDGARFSLKNATVTNDGKLVFDVTEYSVEGTVL